MGKEIKGGKREKKEIWGKYNFLLYQITDRKKNIQMRFHIHLLDRKVRIFDLYSQIFVQWQKKDIREGESL